MDVFNLNSTMNPCIKILNGNRLSTYMSKNIVLYICIEKSNAIDRTIINTNYSVLPIKILYNELLLAANNLQVNTGIHITPCGE